MNINDGQSLRRVAFHAGTRHLPSFVRGVIEHLNIQKLPRVIELRNSVHQTFNHIPFVEDGKLYGNLWPMAHGRRRPWNIFAKREVIVQERVAMHSISGQDKQNQKIGNHHGQIECVGMIDPAKSFVGQLMPVVAKRALLGREQE